MRRFALLQLTEETEAESGSLFWRSVCSGGASDAWEVFQVFRGVMPTAAQVQGSFAVLVFGGSTGASTLSAPHRDALLELLLSFASDPSLPVIAVGSGAQLMAAALVRRSGCSDDVELLLRESCGALVQEVHATSALTDSGWASQLEARLQHADSESEVASAGEKPSGPHQFWLCEAEQLPAEAEILSVARARQSSDSAKGREAAVCWQLRPNVLGLNVCQHPTRCAAETTTASENDSKPGPHAPVPFLQHLVAAFLGVKAGDGSSSETTPPHKSCHHTTASTADAGGLHITSAAESFETRSDLLLHEANVISKTQRLYEAIHTAIASDSEYQSSSATLVSRMLAAVTSQYDGVSDCAKGMRAFLLCLQGKKHEVTSILMQLERIRHHVTKMEILALKLNAAARELESLCCDV